jgi:hypothetical protein
MQPPGTLPNAVTEIEEGKVWIWTVRDGEGIRSVKRIEASKKSLKQHG